MEHTQPHWADESYYRFGNLNTLFLPVQPPITPSKAVEASLLGPDAEVYAAVRAHAEAMVTAAVDELASDPAVCELVERLPLERSTRVLILGDSNTTDWQSWNTILVALLARVRPEVKVRVVDASGPGSTSVEALCRIAQLPLSVRPHWMFSMLGVNDCLRFGAEPETRLIPIEATHHAFAGILRWASGRGVPNPPMWLTPAFTDDHEDLAEGLQRTAADVQEIRALVRELPGPIVDCAEVLATVDEPMLSDGRHFTLAAQQAVAAAVLTTWAATTT